jgi:hydrogenase maturation protease
MVVRAVVIGVGNEFRRDDAAGPAVVALLAGQVPDDVTLTINDGEPTRLIEAWAGTPIAIVVGAVRAEPAVPGRLHGWSWTTPPRNWGGRSARTALGSMTPSGWDGR